MLAVPTLGERGCGRTLGVGIRVLVRLLVIPPPYHREVGHLEGVGLLAAALQRARHAVAHVEVARRDVRRQVQLRAHTTTDRYDIGSARGSTPRTGPNSRGLGRAPLPPFPLRARFLSPSVTFRARGRPHPSLRYVIRSSRVRSLERSEQGNNRSYHKRALYLQSLAIALNRIMVVKLREHGLYAKRGLI